MTRDLTVDVSHLACSRALTHVIEHQTPHSCVHDNLAYTHTHAQEILGCAESEASASIEIVQQVQEVPQQAEESSCQDESK